MEDILHSKHTHTHSKQQNCTFSVLLLWPGRRSETFVANRSSNLGRLRRNVERWRALAKRTILIPKCSNQDEDGGNGSEILVLFIISKVLTKYNLKNEKISEGASRPATGSSHISQEPTFWPWPCARKRKVSESRQDDERGELYQTHTLTQM